jgi:hypothetical protein
MSWGKKKTKNVRGCKGIQPANSMIQYDTMRFEVAREWEMYLEMAMK